MTFIGQIRDGRIELTGNPSLPEGAEVRVEVVEVVEPDPIVKVRPKPIDKLALMLMQVAGKSARRVRHAANNRADYMHDTPKP
jgi:hypothetical protein